MMAGDCAAHLLARGTRKVAMHAEPNSPATLPLWSARAAELSGIDVPGEVAAFVARNPTLQFDDFARDLYERGRIDGQSYCNLVAGGQVEQVALVAVHGATLVLSGAAPLSADSLAIAQPTLELNTGATEPAATASPPDLAADDTAAADTASADTAAASTAAAGTAADADTLAAGDNARAPQPRTSLNFHLLAPIGKGAMGEVHVARDEALRRKVAHKRMLPAAARQSALAARFFAEVQVTAQLDHPHIVPIYALDVRGDGTLGYAMKLVQGQTLTQWLKRDRAAAQANAGKGEPARLAARLEIFLKVCDAIAYAHSRGVVHRDLKPDNIMVGRYNEVYVMDWGICRVLGAPDGVAETEAAVEVDAGEPALRTRIGAVIGTPAYMAPEQAAGQTDAVNGQSDQYALGLILHELVALQRARPNGSVLEMLPRAARGEREPLRHAAGCRVAPEIAAVVSKATALGPSGRYAEVGALAADVRRFLRGDAVAARPDSLPTQALRWLGRHRLAALAVLLGALALGGATTVAALLRGRAQLQAADRHEQRVHDALSAVGQQGHAIDLHFANCQRALAAVAARAEAALQGPVPADGAVFLSQDFTQTATAPADLRQSAVYGQPASLHEAVFNLAPGVARSEVEGQLRQLHALTGALQQAVVVSAVGDRRELTQGEADELLLQQGAPITRIFVTLANGVHMAYPGFGGGFPPGYDGRLRPKYQLAVGQHGQRWGNPYADLSGRGLLLPAAVELHDAAGRPLGVAGVEVTFAALVRELLRVPGRKDVVTAWLVDDRAQVVASTDSKAVAAPQLNDNAPQPLHKIAIAEVVDRIAAGKPGHLRLAGSRLAALEPLRSLGWWYVVELDERLWAEP